MRLINGGVDIYDLARNVGSSVAVVEKFYAELEPALCFPPEDRKS
jgi:hypothetical protein